MNYRAFNKNPNPDIAMIEHTSLCLRLPPETMYGSRLKTSPPRTASEARDRQGHHAKPQTDNVRVLSRIATPPINTRRDQAEGRQGG